MARTRSQAVSPGGHVSLETDRKPRKKAATGPKPAGVEKPSENQTTTAKTAKRGPKKGRKGTGKKKSDESQNSDKMDVEEDPSAASSSTANNNQSEHNISSSSEPMEGLDIPSVNTQPDPPPHGNSPTNSDGDLDIPLVDEDPAPAATQPDSPHGNSSTDSDGDFDMPFPPENPGLPRPRTRRSRSTSPRSGGIPNFTRSTRGATIRRRAISNESLLLEAIRPALDTSPIILNRDPMDTEQTDATSSLPVTFSPNSVSHSMSSHEHNPNSSFSVISTSFPSSGNPQPEPTEDPMETEKTDPTSSFPVATSSLGHVSQPVLAHEHTVTSSVISSSTSFPSSGNPQPERTEDPMETEQTDPISSFPVATSSLGHVSQPVLAHEHTATSSVISSSTSFPSSGNPQPEPTEDPMETEQTDSASTFPVTSFSSTNPGAPRPFSDGPSHTISSSPTTQQGQGQPLSPGSQLEAELWQHLEEMDQDESTSAGPTSLPSPTSSTFSQSVSNEARYDIHPVFQPVPAETLPWDPSFPRRPIEVSRVVVPSSPFLFPTPSRPVGPSPEIEDVTMEDIVIPEPSEFELAFPGFEPLRHRRIWELTRHTEYHWWEIAPDIRTREEAVRGWLLERYPPHVPSETASQHRSSSPIHDSESSSRQLPSLFSTQVPTEFSSRPIQFFQRIFTSPGQTQEQELTQSPVAPRKRGRGQDDTDTDNTRPQKRRATGTEKTTRSKRAIRRCSRSQVLERRQPIFRRNISYAQTRRRMELERQGRVCSSTTFRLPELIAQNSADRLAAAAEAAVAPQAEVEAVEQGDSTDGAPRYEPVAPPAETSRLWGFRNLVSRFIPGLGNVRDQPVPEAVHASPPTTSGVSADGNSAERTVSNHNMAETPEASEQARAQNPQDLTYSLFSQPIDRSSYLVAAESHENGEANAVAGPSCHTRPEGDKSQSLKKRKRSSLKEIPNPPGCSYGMDLDYFCYSSESDGEEVEEDEDQAGKNSPRASKRVRFDAPVPGPQGREEVPAEAEPRSPSPVTVAPVNDRPVMPNPSGTYCVEYSSSTASSEGSPTPPPPSVVARGEQPAPEVAQEPQPSLSEPRLLSSPPSARPTMPTASGRRSHHTLPTLSGGQDFGLGRAKRHGSNAVVVPEAWDFESRVWEEEMATDDQFSRDALWMYQQAPSGDLGRLPWPSDDRYANTVGADTVVERLVGEVWSEQHARACFDHFGRDFGRFEVVEEV